MGYFGDKSDIVRLMAEDLRKEHGEEQESTWPTVLGVVLGVVSFWFLLGLL